MYHTQHVIEQRNTDNLSAEPVHRTETYAEQQPSADVNHRLT